jgi:hypothetical protein
MENGLIGENAISDPSNPGLTRRMVMRGGFVLVDALMFMMFASGMRS